MTSNGLIHPEQFLDPTRARGSTGLLFGDITLKQADKDRICPPMDPKNLGELVAKIEADEALLNEDAVVPVRALTMTEQGTLKVPERGAYRLTPWSKKQLSGRLGIKWDRWFEGIDPKLRSTEINRRLGVDAGTVRVRTDMTLDPFEGGDGALRALVSPSYSPIPDALIARGIMRSLSGGEGIKVSRYTETDRTTSYVVQIGEPFSVGGPARVGEVAGGLLVRNSGVGFASLLVSLGLTRLICTNGMTIPERAMVLHRAHQRLKIEAIEAELREGLHDLPARIHRGAVVLERSGHHAIRDVRQALKDVLVETRLPVKMLALMLAAYEREPHPSAFGVTQALTLGAQHASVSPEDRIALERAAGEFLGRYLGEG